MKLWKKSVAVLMTAVMVASITPIQAKAAEEGGTTEEAITQYDGYDLVWNDEFDGDALDLTKWNYEPHEPGWVNAEWQEYTTSTDNVYVKDGNLVIQPIKTVDEEGNTSYTSGRINTQKTQTFTYGKFEARLKVPTGKGYLPAFWLMAADENIYGQWPKCGEIDIMEVMGNSTDTLHGTIHYGSNSSTDHKQSQGTHTVKEDEKDFAEDFHTFTCEWEPGKITWYVDGIEYHQEDEWYTSMNGEEGVRTYPAPFDQPFYIILNLAIGGSWVGYPDETTTYEDQSYQVDYVRVYQKTDGYDENVTRPEEEEVELRDPATEDGNYLYNGDFETAEDFAEAVDWQFATAESGVATATIVDDSKLNSKAVLIETENAGTVDYSVQFMQANVPLEKGGVYELSFDAYASEARDMGVDVKAPDKGYITYMPSKTAKLTTEKDTYTYTFTMQESSDANGRLEFNMGAKGSTADIVIDNVAIKRVGTDDSVFEEKEKTVLSNGNYIYNGEFMEGEDPKYLGYWNIPDDAAISVTSLADGRKLKVEVPENDSVTISQDDVPVTAEASYALSLDAVVPEEGAVEVAFDGQSYTVEPDDKGSWNAELKTSAELDDKTISITFEGAGTYYIDNVSLVENTLIKNGSFDAGFAGYEPFKDGSADASWVVDSQSEDNAADFTINNSGDQAWKIQLKQTGVDMEKDQWYKLSFKIKSDLKRNVTYAIQRDGSVHKTAEGNEDWQPYVEATIELNGDGEYQTINKEFQMEYDDDLGSIFNISMGGGSITDQHRICIDDIVLEKIDEPEITIPSIEVGVNQIKNSTFEDDSVWNLNQWGGGVATNEVVDGAMVIDVTAVGSSDGEVALQQAGLTLEKGETYTLSFDVTSDVARDIKACFMTVPGYGWYGGKVFSVPANEMEHIEWTFEINQYISDKIVDITDIITLGIHLGNLNDEGTAVPAKLTFDNFSLVKLDEDGIAIAAVKEKIKAIGTVTLDSKEKIDAARTEYDALTDAQKEKFDASALEILTNAEVAYSEAQVADAIAKIDAIGKVTYSEDSKKAIDAAKAAYDALSAEQKAAVDKAKPNAIANAEKAYADEKTAYEANEENKKKDAEAIAAVVEKIKAIGTVTIDSKAKIDEARAAYDALTQAQKDQFDATVLKTLTDAEQAYEKAVADKKAEEDAKYVAKFPAKSTTIQKGKSSSALASALTITAGDKVKKWTTSKKSVVSVNSKTGKIKAKKTGTATITATTEKGKTASIKVKVVKKKVKTTKVTVLKKSTNKTLKNNSTVTLSKKKTLQLKTVLTPITSPEKVTYKSSNKKIATVSSKGKITAKKKGKATITVKSGKKSVKIKVKVK